MADQGLWFKLWCTAPSDPDIGNLSLENFARWCLLGAYLKVHGNDGLLCISKPAEPLRNFMRCQSFEHLLSTLKMFPNCDVHEKQEKGTDWLVPITIEWKNWSKYQGDYSTYRTQRFKERERFKKRREEKRKEEKRVVFTPPQVLEVSEYAKSLSFNLDAEKFVSHYQARGWQFKNGSPMKDWKAAVVTWKKNGFKNGNGNGNDKPDWA